MKKIVIYLAIAATTFLLLQSCGKEEEQLNFENIEIKDARLENNQGLLTIVDEPKQIIQYEDYGGLIDTLGETKVFLHHDLWVYREWGSGYMSSRHEKTKILYGFKKGLVIALIRSSTPFYDRLYVYNNGVKKEFPFTLIEVKKVEVNLNHQVLKITYNNSWIRTGEITDESKEFNY